jgi:hypothetical protein
VAVFFSRLWRFYTIHAFVSGKKEHWRKSREAVEKTTAQGKRDRQGTAQPWVKSPPKYAVQRGDRKCRKMLFHEEYGITADVKVILLQLLSKFR